MQLLSNCEFIFKQYSYGCTGGGVTYTFTGSYTIDSSYLTLVPKYVETIEYDDYIEINDTLNRYETHTQHAYDTGTIITKTNFKIIKWEGNTYLLSDSKNYGYFAFDQETDFEKFARSIQNNTEIYKGQYLAHRTTDSITTPFDITQIPKKHQYLFKKKHRK